MERWTTKDGVEITTERTRERQVKVRLTEEEYQTLQQLCFELDCSQSEFFRRSIMQCPMVNMEDLRGIMAELKREGSNLNQIAVKLNSTGFVNHRGLENTMEELRATWQQLRQLLQRLR